MKQKISITIDIKTLDGIDSIIDNIFIRNRSQAIEHLVNSSLGENKIAVILGGGDEKKQKIDENSYRPTAKINEQTIIELAIKKLRENGFKTIFIIAKEKILTKIFEVLKDGSSFGVKITYVEEKRSIGTAESLKLLKGKINSDFLVVYSDLIFSKIKIDELWKTHLKNDALATLMMTTSSKPSEKGTLTVEGNKILNFTQKPKKSDIYLVFSPIFAAEAELLEYDGDSLEKDVFPMIAEKGLLEGHLSSEKEIHIHTIEDVKKYRKT